MAVAESTPGPIAINMATFVGYRTAGVLGSAAATFGVVLPSFVIIYLLSFVIRQFQEFKPVQYAFAGIRAGGLALIVKAWISMFKACPKAIFSYVIAGLSLIVAVFVDISVLWVIVGCAICGIVYSAVRQNKGGIEK